MRVPPASNPCRSSMPDPVPPGRFRNTSRAALAALYPSKCVFCGRTDRLVPDAGGCCSVCLALLPHRRPPDRLLSCRARPDPLVCLSALPVIAAMYYESPVRDLLLRFKFSREAGLHPALSAAAARAMRMERGSLAAWPDIVAAVPLHRDRLRERGFNQAGLLAEGVAQAIGAVDRSDALLRIRATRRQSSVTGRTERDANLSGAFRVLDPLAFRGRSVLIVDDVLTSGATMQACAEAVARFSPVALTGLVVACGRPPSLRIDSVPLER